MRKGNPFFNSYSNPFESENIMCRMGSNESENTHIYKRRRYIIIHGKRYVFRMLTKSFMCRRRMNGKDGTNDDGILVE